MDSKVALIAGYLRVSTPEQKKKGYSPEVQRERIETYVANTFPDEPYELTFFEDLGTTGAFGLRQHPDLFGRQFRAGLSDAIDRLLVEAPLRPVHFVCLDQSRLEREPFVWHLIHSVYIVRHGIVFHLVDEGGEIVSNPETMLTRGVTSLANASQRHSTSRREAEAHEHRIRQGYHNGRPPFGWAKGPSQDGGRWRDLVPVPEQQDAVRAIKDKILAGWGAWRVAEWLQAQGVIGPTGNPGWYQETVGDLIKNPVHGGYVAYRGELIKGRHYDARLWDIDVTHELERVMHQRHRSRKRGVVLGDFLLAGLMTCGHCGHPVAACYGTSPGQRYYRCNGRIARTSDSHAGYAKLASQMEAGVVDEIRRVLSDDLVRDMTARQVAQVAERELQQLKTEEYYLKQKRSEAAKDLGEAIAMHRRGDLSKGAFQATSDQMERRIQDSDDRMAEIKLRRRSLAANEVRLQSARDAARHFTTMWEQLDTEERRGLLQALLDEIVVTKEGRRLRLRFVFHFFPAVERVLLPANGAASGLGADQLAMRELAFLHHWTRGLGHREIAHVFDVTLECARQLQSSVLRKLGVASLDEAALLAADRIELHLANLPLTGRLNRRNGAAMSLSQNERRAIEGAGAGLSFREIALQHGVSLDALYAAAHGARIKLGATSNRDALEKATALGLL